MQVFVIKSGNLANYYLFRQIFTLKPKLFMKKIIRIFGSLLILLMMVAACSKDSYEPSLLMMCWLAIIFGIKR